MKKLLLPVLCAFLGVSWFVGSVYSQEFTNSLGMKFVPVPGTNILMATTPVTVDQYKASGVEYKKPGFEQGGDHPAVNVSWDDAQAYVEWLSKKEGKKYRLPTDHEWSCAVGIGEQEDANASPADKDKKVEVYPWGTSWPPPNNAGNYDSDSIEGYSDKYEYTSPVGSYASNKLGIYDLGGNVWEWCEDKWDKNSNSRVLRGAAWCIGNRVNLHSSCRRRSNPVSCIDCNGFRVVVER